MAVALFSGSRPCALIGLLCAIVLVISLVIVEQSMEDKSTSRHKGDSEANAHQHQHNTEAQETVTHQLSVIARELKEIKEQQQQKQAISLQQQAGVRTADANSKPADSVRVTPPVPPPTPLSGVSVTEGLPPGAVISQTSDEIVASHRGLKCEDVLSGRSSFGYNKVIATDTFGSTGQRKKDPWVGWCTCLHRTETIFDASLRHIYGLIAADLKQKGIPQKHLVSLHTGRCASALSCAVFSPVNAALALPVFALCHVFFSSCFAVS